MFGTFGVCVKTTEEINERPSYVHGRVLPVLASTVGACVLVIRVLPVLASTVLVYLWLKYFQCLRVLCLCTCDSSTSNACAGNHRRLVFMAQRVGRHALLPLAGTAIRQERRSLLYYIASIFSLSFFYCIALVSQLLILNFCHLRVCLTQSTWTEEMTDTFDLLKTGRAPPK